ncbi:alkaline phosphatase family protein [Methanocaldococcus sp.]
MEKNRKVIVIGFDGASWNYLNSMIKEGLLPNFEYLVKNGVTATMKSTIPPITVPAWQCMFSGYNPGYIGAVDFKRRIDSFRFELVSPKLWKGLMIWDRMKNVKTLVMNIPFTYPPYKINGHMVPLEFTPEFGHTYPPDLANELDEKFGIRHLPRIENIPDPKNRIKALYEIDKAVLEMFIYLVKKYKYDLSIVRFGVPDTISHQTTNSDELKKAYIFADSLLGKILEEFYNSDYTFFLVSDHGLEFVSKRVCINYFLYKNNYLKLNFKGKVRIFLTKLLLPLIEKWKEEIVHLSNILRSKNFKHRFEMIGVDLFKYIDPNKTLAFSRVSSGFRQFPIYLTVNPKDSKYDKIRDEIILALKNLTSNDGEKIISKIWKREEIYRGPYIEAMPDLVVESKYCLFVPLIGRLFLNIKTFAHSSDGIFIAFGKNIKSCKNIGEVKIYDVAPTLYYLFDYTIPANCDGRVLVNIFDEDFVNSHTVSYEDCEKVKIKEKIKNLKLR